MKGWGGVLLVGGIVGVVLAMGMDTSVSTGFGRVNNIGLMKDQQNIIMVAGIAILAGLLLMIKSPDKSNSSEISHPKKSSENLKICPECAESIKLDAKLCRYCGNKEFPEASYDPPEYGASPTAPTTWQKLWWIPEDRRR